MKNNFAILSGIVRKTRQILPAIAALLFVASTTNSYAVKFGDPTGNDWDCVTSGGGQDGIIFFHFTTDIDTNSGLPTFEGVFVNAGVRNTLPNPRGVVGTGRTGSTNNPFLHTNLFGGGAISGSVGGVADNGGENDWFTDSRGLRGDWFFNNKGQIVGSYFTVVNVSGLNTNFFPSCTNVTLVILLTNDTIFTPSFDICFTNGVFSTNIPWGPAPDGETGSQLVSLINTNFTVTPLGLTNSVSFVGTVVPGKRLTLVGSSRFGNVSYRGVPLVQTAVPVDEFTWSGQKLQDGVMFQELFNMAPSSIPNQFDISGVGPFYTYQFTNSFCLISSQKKIGFSITELPVGVLDSELGNVRASIGPFISTKKTIGAKTSGFDSAVPTRIHFNASAVTAGP